MKRILYAAMDVHKETIQIAIFDEISREPILEKGLLHDKPTIKRFFSGYPPEVEFHTCYEAGCLGFDLHRYLLELGIKNIVVAPANIPRAATHMSKKTDRSDARLLGQMLRGGHLTPIHIPSIADEAVRDYLRLRHDLTKNRQQGRQRLLAFLLRHHLRYESGESHWTLKHFQWLGALKLDLPVLQQALNEHIVQIESLNVRIKAMDKEIDRLADTEPYCENVRRLSGLKGIATLTALSLLVEVGDFRRFPTAPAFMAYLGLVPREHSSGSRRQLGGITKCGNTHLRTLLVESCWCYRYSSKSSLTIARRRADATPAMRSYYEKASKHLETKFRYMILHLKKSSQITVTATARELAGFIWGVMMEKTA